MSDLDVTTTFATILVDEWARAGCTEAVIAPGSRSAPLALALARDERVQLSVLLDERSAAFRALGIGRATGKPAVVLCTSGTAAANFHPAVIEAAHGRVPMLVCTADRPPELRDTGAGQTIDQTKLYGDAVRWFCDPGPPTARPGAGEAWRALACRAVSEALGPPAGPVHLNLPFREPLVPTGAAPLHAPGRPNGQPWTSSATIVSIPDAATVERLTELVHHNPRGVLVAGWGAAVSPGVAHRFARAAGWPVLADPISGLRSGPLAISTYEALLRADGFATAHEPDLVLRIGAPLTSKVADAWLGPHISQVVVDPDDAWLDPARAATERVVVDAEALLGALADALGPERVGDRTWLDDWLGAECRARRAMDRVLDAADAPFEGVVARDVAAVLPDGASLVVASSLPVRALEWCMAPRAGLKVFSNRGANGIDGFVSTVLGIASQASQPVVALCGDLCFLHDINGLLGAADHLPVTFVVIDNDGGGIFSFLPQVDLPEFEELFATPHGLDLVAVARAHGASADRVPDLVGIREALVEGSARVLVVPVDRVTSVARHRALWTAVAADARTGSD